MADCNPVWDEITLLQSSWLTIWQSFMRSFSWHFFIHLGVLGTLFTSTALQGQAQLIAWLMGAFATLGAVAAASMWGDDHKSPRSSLMASGRARCAGSSVRPPHPLACPMGLLYHKYGTVFCVV
jgi:hypothetical protein